MLAFGNLSELKRYRSNPGKSKRYQNANDFDISIISHKRKRARKQIND